MRWEGRRQSDNVEDRRGRGGMSPQVKVGGGLGLVAVLVGLFFGVDVSALLGGGGSQPAAQSPGAQAPRSRIYSYYNPQVGAEALPIEFRVD